MVATFLLLFTNKNWLNTFTLFAVVTFVLTLTFAIMSAVENEELRTRWTNDAKHSLAACIISFLALGPQFHVLYCCFFVHEKKVEAPPVEAS